MKIGDFALATLPRRGEAFPEFWRRARQLGIVRYVAQTAVLWTALTVVFFEVLQFARTGAAHYQSMIVRTFPNGLIVLFGSGLIVAALLWLYNEWRFQSAGGK